MLSTNLAVFIAAIGTYFSMQVADTWFVSFLDKINRGKGFKIPTNVIVSAISKTLLAYIIAFVIYISELNAAGIILLLSIVLIFVNLFLIMKANLQLFIMKKSPELTRKENQMEQDFEFIKGLY